MPTDGDNDVTAAAAVPKRSQQVSDAPSGRHLATLRVVQDRTWTVWVMGMGMVAATVLGCEPSATTTCDDILCPKGTLCLDGYRQCFDEADVTACRAAQDGQRCSSPGIDEGSCRGGVCFVAGCGDGVIDDGETCDGGNTSCLQIGFYDEGVAQCNNRCQFDGSTCSGSCGDGIVNGPELCDGELSGGRSCFDLGFDLGRPECSSICSPTFDNCQVMGWEPQFPAIEAAFALAVGPQGGMYIGNYLGELAELGDGGWTTSSPASALGFAGGVRDIALDGDENVYIAFEDMKVGIRVAGSWSQLPDVPNPDDQLYPRIYEIWADAPDNVLALTHRRLFHWNGTAWAELRDARDGGNSSRAYSNMWVLDSGDIYLKGFRVDEHFDGQIWTTGDVFGDLTGVVTMAGENPEDLLVVTDDVGVTPSGLGGVYEYNAVEGNSELVQRIYANGGAVRATSLGNGAFVVLATVVDFNAESVHHKRWYRSHGAWLEEDLDVLGIDNRVQVVGGGGTALYRNDTAISRLAGSAWMPPFSLGAGGGQGSSALASFDGEHLLGRGGVFDGTSWNNAGAGNLAQLAPGEVWSFGELINGTVPPPATVHRFNGVHWDTTGIPAPSYPAVLHGTSESNLVLATWDDTTGDIFRYDGAEWRSLEKTGEWWALWATESTIFAGGPTGLSIYQNGEWSEPSELAGQPIRDLWVDGDDFAVAVADSGQVFHFASGAWMAMPSSITTDFIAVWGNSRDNIYAIARQRILVHFDGTAWSRVRTPLGPVELKDVYILGERPIISDTRTIYFMSSAP